MFVPLRPDEESCRLLGNLEDSIKDELVRKCIHALIILGQNRTPIKRMDLNRLAFPLENYRITGPIVQAANKELDKVFGMRLFEIEDRTKLLLVNSKTDFSDLIEHSDESCEELSILCFVLMDIFASPEERVAEDDIQAALEPLDYTRENIKTFLDSLVKRLYLKVEKRQDTKLYSWGPRAVAEIDPEEFFRCFLNMNGDKTDKDWPDLRKRIDKLKSIAHR